MADRELIDIIDNQEIDPNLIGAVKRQDGPGSGVDADTVRDKTPEQIAAMAPVQEAPQDGQEYVRRNASWVVSSGGGGGGTSEMIYPPSITTPADGATDFSGAVIASAYSTYTSFTGPHQWSEWQFSVNSDFSTIDHTSGQDTANLTSYTPSGLDANTTYYVRVRYGSDYHASWWSAPISFTTPNTYIEAPTVTVTGEPDQVPETPTITGSAFTVVNGSDTHQSTTWRVKDGGGTVVWESVDDTANLTSIDVPAGNLQTSTTYSFEVTYNGATYTSGTGVKSATTKDNFGFVVDVFGDGSGYTLNQFDNDPNDLGGLHNGTWSGNALYDVGKIAQSAKFDGSSRITLASSSTSLMDGNEFSVSFFIKPTANDGFIIGQFDYVSGPGNKGWGIQIGSDLKLVIRLGTNNYSGVELTADTALVEGVWSHVVATLNRSGGATSVKMYIDNSDITLTSNGGNDEWISISKDIDIGATNTSYGTVSSLQGELDHLRIFTRSISPTEVTDLYNEGS